MIVCPGSAFVILAAVWRQTAELMQFPWPSVSSGASNDNIRNCIVSAADQKIASQYKRSGGGAILKRRSMMTQNPVTSALLIYA